MAPPPPEPPPVPPPGSRLPRQAPFDQSDVQAAGRQAERLPDPLPENPLPLLVSWFDEAAALAVQPNPNAMTLATVDAEGRPAARIVLCKEIDAERGTVAFYTNYTSDKGRQLAAMPYAALVMHWDVLDRQVRLRGPVTMVDGEESDAYFASRPWSSRIGAWASDQSSPIEGREAMRAKVVKTMLRFGIDPENPPAENAEVQIPRPPHWGGYRLYIERLELWTSGAGRVHDRAVWERAVRIAEGHPPDMAPWQPGVRLQP